MLADMLEKNVSVLTNDGRNLTGILHGFDQITNLVLTHTTERIFDPNKPVEHLQLGAYIVRGPDVALIGEVDEQELAKLDLHNARPPPLKPINL